VRKIRGRTPLFLQQPPSPPTAPYESTFMCEPVIWFLKPFHVFDEKYLGAFGFGVIIGVKENDEWMTKVSYLDEREWMVKREIGRKKH